jgi:hypothetical protein
MCVVLRKSSYRQGKALITPLFTNASCFEPWQKVVKFAKIFGQLDRAARAFRRRFVERRSSIARVPSVLGTQTFVIL